MKKIIITAICFSAISSTSLAFVPQTSDHSHGAHHHALNKHELTLNEGQKWQMDEHTRKMSKQMKSTFFSADHSDLKSLKSLGSNLQSQLDSLISGCTMTGKAHDQLHVFLSEHIPTISALTNAENYDTAKKNAIELKGQFEMYERYFK